MKPVRADLARTYKQAVYIAELPEGRVEFRFHAPPLGPAPAEPLAVVTAWNPGTQRPSGKANMEANRRLEQALQSAGRRYYPACGRSEDGSHAEPSFAIIGIDSVAAIELAAAFNQVAVFYWDGEKPHLLWCGP